MTGRTKTEVKAKLRALRDEIAQGVHSSATYTLQNAVDDWLREGLDGKSARTVELYRGRLNGVTDAIGAMWLRDLSAHDVRAVLVKIGETTSTRNVKITHNCLTRAIRHAQANDHVARNVAELTNRPEARARDGRPRPSLSKRR